jgi:hypothetical protein
MEGKKQWKKNDRDQFEAIDNPPEYQTPTTLPSQISSLSEESPIRSLRIHQLREDLA